MSDTPENPPEPKAPWWTWHWLPTVAGIVLGSTLGIIIARTGTPKPAPPAPQSVVIQEIFGCQFMVFQNPFFILHYPKCYAHGTGYPSNRLEVSIPMPPRPSNMPAP